MDQSKEKEIVVPNLLGDSEEEWTDGTLEPPKEPAPVVPPPITPPPPPPEPKKEAQPLVAQQTGLLIGSSLEQEYRLAKAYYSSGLMPKALNSTEKVLVALQLCRELNLPPMISIGKIAVINGVPSIFGDLPLALVMKSGKMESIDEEFILDDKRLIFAVKVSTMRKGHAMVIREFSLDDARRAKLAHKDIWQAYPKRMLQMRARSWALKDAFPDVLAGVSIAEYDHNVAPEFDNIKQVENSVTDVSKTLEDKYAPRDEDQEQQNIAGSTVEAVHSLREGL